MIVKGLKYLNYSDRLIKLKLPTLAHRRTRGDMITTFKLLNNCFDPTLPPLLQESNTRDRLRGHSKKLFMSRSNKDIGKKITNRIVKLWNSLPDDVLNAKDIITFEKNI